MLTLAVDTCLDACTAVVGEDGRVLAAISEPMSRGHQERLAPMVAELMKTAGLTFDRLERIGATVGPGSFTGLRIGLALSFILMFAAEMVGSKTGLGYLVIRAEDSLRFDLMYASILAIGVLGFASDRALMLVRQKLMAGRSSGHVDYV